jgi:hypothetical protein
MEKRWWQYERRPKSQYLFAIAVLCAIFAMAQFGMKKKGFAAGYAAVCAINLGFCLRERRKERNDQGTLV